MLSSPSEPTPNDSTASGEILVPPATTVSTPNRGSFRLFRLAGTDVFVHWSWFVAAYFLMRNEASPDASLGWAALEYVAGFGVVLLHEFGHVLACRRVGGSANRIVVWPLGGLAFVTPPPRPWPTLWTIVAGPLVNVVLAPGLFVLAYLAWPADDAEPTALGNLTLGLAVFNVGLLIFNLLPIYPLDGGRILQALLWRLFGLRASLMVAGGIGIVAGTGLGLLAVSQGEWWLTAVAFFLVGGAFGAVKQAQILGQLSQGESTDALGPDPT